MSGQPRGLCLAYQPRGVLSPYWRPFAGNGLENRTLLGVETEKVLNLPSLEVIAVELEEADLRALVGKNIARYRKAHGDTQAALGQKLRYSDKAVSKWERGVSQS